MRQKNTIKGERKGKDQRRWDFQLFSRCDHHFNTHTPNETEWFLLGFSFKEETETGGKENREVEVEHPTKWKIVFVEALKVPTDYMNRERSLSLGLSLSLSWLIKLIHANLQGSFLVSGVSDLRSFIIRSDLSHASWKSLVFFLTFSHFPVLLNVFRLLPILCNSKERDFLDGWIYWKIFFRLKSRNKVPKKDSHKTEETISSEKDLLPPISKWE